MVITVSSVHVPEVVEGVVVEDGCVISMGVFIGQSNEFTIVKTGEILWS